MELQFEMTTNVGVGINPAAIHLPDNSVYLFAVDGGRLKAKSWKPLSGDVNWALPDFNDPITATLDKALSLYRIKNVPRVGMFGAWHQESSLKNPERQRLGIWDAINDLSPYLESGTIRLDIDNIVSSASLTFYNPNNILSGEETSRVAPGKKIELNFNSGASEDYQMGIFYVDRVEVSTDNNTITVDCRNIAGKLLNDQKMDGQNYYPKKVYAYMVEDFLRAAGITDFEVQQPSDPLTAWQAGLYFPPEMDRLTAMNEMLKISLNWVIRETLDGKMIVGSEVTYQPLLDMFGTYTFERGSELFTREVVRDDAEVYSKICYYSRHETVVDNEKVVSIKRKYCNVELDLDLGVPSHKTLYVEAPDQTPEEELLELATSLASRMVSAGVTEQFSGPFRPYLVPGDEAKIIGTNGETLIGIITTIEHSFGRNGFTTSFTVDSAGLLRKPSLSRVITNANRPKLDTSIQRL